jgi:predicted TIM-barrel fold metal-dependent hydrolase
MRVSENRAEAKMPGAGWDCHVHLFDSAHPARAGHYTPTTDTLADIETLAAAHGVQHLVLVQPSVYGSDNRLILQALAQEPGRHRAVVVLAGDESEGTLNAMHEAGVRGVRINRVSPVGQALDLKAWLPRLAQRGWHLQWYVHATQLQDLAAHQTPDVPFVLDHLAGLHALLSGDDPAWLHMATLARGGAWIKLSGWYRLQAQLPYTELGVNIQRVATLFGSRLVWGSDWPHTGLADGQKPSYAQTWLPVQHSLEACAARHARCDAPAQLYAP